MTTNTLTPGSPGLVETAELIAEARRWQEPRLGAVHERSLIRRLADLLERAAPRFIDTEKELDELPAFAVVMDSHGDVSQKRGNLWCGYETAPITSHRLAKSGPFAIIYRPQEG